MSDGTTLGDYQQAQENILYGNGTHESHDMFLDMDDMYMYCLKCRHPRDNFENKHLKEPCIGHPHWEDNDGRVS